LNRFLIVRLGSLGDVVHAIPFAAALRERFLWARIDWMVDPKYEELLELVPALDHRVPIDPRDLWSSARRSRFLQTMRELRAVKYDVVFDLQGLLKSAVLARAVGARRVVGFPKRCLREPLAHLLYSETPDPGGAAHVVDMNLALLAAVKIDERQVRFPLAIPQSEVVDSVVERFAHGFMVINPGAAWPNKRWPADHFGAVAAAVRQAYGLRTVVLWGPGERELADEVAAASNGAAEVLPATTIQDVAGLARAAQLMISGDTGPLHVAAAVGTPLVSLFGPTRPERNGPLAVHDIAISRVDGCSCVYERRCRRSVPCINDITVDEVVDAVTRRLIARRHSASA
jgi:heptosyltransferase I